MSQLLFVLFFLAFEFCAGTSNDFAIVLYKNLAQENERAQKNIFFSPYSIRTAMEVAYEGARGTTADELADVFKLDSHAHTRRTDSKKFIELLNRHTNEYTLLTADALWVEKSFKVLPTYQTVAQKWYNANIKKANFKHTPQKAESVINAWVQHQTQGMIPTILAPNSLNELTRLVITNAIYFKGIWKSPFDVEQTKEEDFFINETTTKKIPMMYATKEYGYAENDVAQIVELDYVGDVISILIVLPKDKNLGALESMLTVENFEAWKLDIEKQKVAVHIPRVKLDTSYELVETFKKMGIKQAFNASVKVGADFSGIDGKRDLYIALINHKAALEINEEGTTAAAATAVAMMMKSMMPRPIPTFRADHPFIIMIQEKTTGTLLFIGRIIDPQESMLKKDRT